MINQIYQILQYYKLLKENGTPEEKELISLAIPAAVKWLKEYLNPTDTPA